MRTNTELTLRTPLQIKKEHCLYLGCPLETLSTPIPILPTVEFNS